MTLCGPDQVNLFTVEDRRRPSITIVHIDVVNMSLMGHGSFEKSARPRDRLGWVLYSAAGLGDAIDSKLRGCGLVQIKIGDLVSGGQVRTRAIVMQQKTGRPVQFEMFPDARASLLALA
jgi:hypothetical protein